MVRSYLLETTMRIISKFHDYYDGVSAYGYDKADYIYKRKTQEPPEVPLAFLKLVEAYSRMPRYTPYYNGTQALTGNNLFIHNYLIGFCGSIYPFYHVRVKESEKMCQSIEEVTSFVVDHVRDINRGKQLLKIIKGDSRYWRDFFEYRKYYDKKVEETFMGFQGDELFRDINAPIFLIKNISTKHYGIMPSLIINPFLKDLYFAKIIDPYTAYQEIDMYLGNNLANQADPIPERTDDLIAHAHGFNDISFKNLPTKKNKRKKKFENKRA